MTSVILNYTAGYSHKIELAVADDEALPEALYYGRDAKVFVFDKVVGDGVVHYRQVKSQRLTLLEAEAPKLSPTEILVVRHLMQGAPNKVIGIELGISEATVKVHVKSILRKLRLNNRTQLAVHAYFSLGMKT